MFVHPFMPDLSNKSLDDLIKEQNDIYVKMRSVRNSSMLQQMQMVLQGYKDEYAKRMSQEMERKPKSKNKTENKTDD